MQVFQSIAKDVMLRLRDSQTDSPSAGAGSGNVHLSSTTASAKQSKGCC